MATPTGFYSSEEVLESPDDGDWSTSSLEPSDDDDPRDELPLPEFEPLLLLFDPGTGAGVTVVVTVTVTVDVSVVVLVPLASRSFVVVGSLGGSAFFDSPLLIVFSMVVGLPSDPFTTD